MTTAVGGAAPTVPRTKSAARGIAVSQAKPVPIKPGAAQLVTSVALAAVLRTRPVVMTLLAVIQTGSVVVSISAVLQRPSSAAALQNIALTCEAKRKSSLLSREFHPLKKREYDSAARLRAVTGKR
jgi:hypothetical protein